MARTDGIGRGLLHGTLIGAAALAALSLALPSRETARDADIAVDTPAEIPLGAPQDTSGNAISGPVPDTQVQSVPRPDPIQMAVEDAASASTPQGSPGAETQMRPPTGSEFARAEDLPPTVPGSANAPATVAELAEVAEPAPETLPRQTTGPASRPDAQDEAVAPHAAQDDQLAAAAPQAETAAPATQANPARVSQPGQDQGPAAASRAAPTAPEQAEDTALPASESLPTTSAVQRPDMPGGTNSPASASTGETANGAPAVQTGVSPAGNPADDDNSEAARPADADTATDPRTSAPVLQTPDPRRESVPPPPPAAGDDVAATAPEQVEQTPAISSRPGDAPQGVPTGRPAPDLEIPALPMTSMP
ncbi:MAG: hypothetical protein DI616_02410 [Paracoccus denitrificans]|uniref:Uncharacterized protein n=1 Tax=Paracoccus denitrificans TaxID=266 RepID=A0A533IBS0_PARDE|nr:MAG: hypothetical protein DI616_02410 [Paracoccus denitrificans]